ncbi:Hypothetical_protein [Hexamita inflata]|uniref:Hypothetical_protein n=1 Tax=Hexamita inflata TaxID=28002 RepID=A0AA86TSD6_9EUKA|nr:Hypothetical protein HINF_LOCUS12632 [Hexamita inflata]
MWTYLIWKYTGDRLTLASSQPARHAKESLVAQLAQLDSAPDYGSGGSRFKSWVVHIFAFVVSLKQLLKQQYTTISNVIIQVNQNINISIKTLEQLVNLYLLFN